MLQPRESLVPRYGRLCISSGGHAPRRLDYHTGAWSFDHESFGEAFDQRCAGGLEGFGRDHRAAVCAAGAVLQYLRDTQKVDLAHVRSIAFRSSADCLLIDPITLRHLEVVESVSGTPEGSLLHAIDRTVTPKGGRLLRSWLLRPLVALERIADRLDAVEDFAFRTTERGKFRDVMKTVHDMNGSCRGPHWSRRPATLVAPSSRRRRSHESARSCRIARHIRCQGSSARSMTSPTFANRSRKRW